MLFKSKGMIYMKFTHLTYETTRKQIVMFNLFPGNPGNFGGVVDKIPGVLSWVSKIS